jgi:diacylglycerol kinase
MKFLKRFQFAFEGLFFLVKKDKNIQLHLVFLALAIGISFYFKLSTLEWISILICSALVLTLEAINTGLEEICNLIDTDFNLKIKLIKDISAAAVLIASIFSAVVGAIIFIPKFISLL